MVVEHVAVVIRTAVPLAVLLGAAIATAVFVRSRRAVPFEPRVPPAPLRRLSECLGRELPVAPFSSRCEYDGADDVDGDGLLDCWRVRRDVPEQATLIVWPSCRGEALTFDIEPSGMTLLAVPPALSSPRWLHWIAARLVGERGVSCAGDAIRGCPPPTSAWRWVLDSANRFDARPGFHGTVAAAWAPLESGSNEASALIVPSVPDGWMERRRGPEEEEPERSRAGARIIVDATTRSQPPLAQTCAGHNIVRLRGGVGEWDEHHAKFRWLWRGLADYGGFEVDAMACLDDVLVARTTTPFAHMVAIDLQTGGWLFEPATDCCDGAFVWAIDGAIPGERYLWMRDNGRIIPVRALGQWLHEPAQRRSVLNDRDQPRPELDNDQAMNASYVRDWGELADPFPEKELATSARAQLDHELTCGGWRIAWSSTAILASRNSRVRWLAVEHHASPRRISAVTCRGARVLATRVGTLDTFSDPRAQQHVEQTFELDPVRGVSRELSLPR